MIEETHKTVTEMEEKRRKVEEIIAILQKYCNASSWTSNVERSEHFPKNVGTHSPPPTDFCRKKPEPKPPMLTPKSREIVARQESTTQKISEESTSRNAKKRCVYQKLYIWLIPMAMFGVKRLRESRPGCASLTYLETLLTRTMSRMTIRFIWVCLDLMPGVL